MSKGLKEEERMFKREKIEPTKIKRLEINCRLAAYDGMISTSKNRLEHLVENNCIPAYEALLTRIFLEQSAKKETTLIDELREEFPEYHVTMEDLWVEGSGIEIIKKS